MDNGNMTSRKQTGFTYNGNEDNKLKQATVGEMSVELKYDPTVNNDTSMLPESFHFIL